MVYEAKFIIKLRSMSKEVADFEDNFNKSMEDFGSDYKISTSAEIIKATIKVDRELTEEEEYKISAILKAQVIESMPKYDIRLKSFSRQSESSVSQSAE